MAIVLYIEIRSMEDKNNFCFCGLALGLKYRSCARDLAHDLEKYHPNTYYLILTDNAADFADLDNVIAINHRQNSVMFPYHDRRFAIEESLSRFDMTIQIDTDVRILKPLVFSEELSGLKGIVANSYSLSKHLGQYQSDIIDIYRNVAKRLEIDFEQATYIGEFIFAVGKDNGKEKEFIDNWGKIGRYLELHRVHGADGPAIGLAAAKTGFPVYASQWPWTVESEFVDHLKFSSGKNKIDKSTVEKLKFRLAYHYRLNKSRLLALKDFRFYYSD